MLGPFGPRTRFLLAAVSATLILATGACRSTVMGGNGASAAAGGAGGAGVAGVAGPISAVAVWGDWLGPPGDEGWGGENGGWAAGVPEGPVLWLRVGNQPPACHSEFAPGCPAVLPWELNIGLPSEAQQPGTYPVDSPPFLSLISESDDFDGAGGCMSSRGIFYNGTLTILSVDAANITFTLSGAQNSRVDADGTFTAPICSQ